MRVGSFRQTTSLRKREAVIHAAAAS